MSLKRNVFLILLSTVYLLFEFAFNARLLDVVGSVPTKEQVHSIEVYGRMLSGIAMALFALKILLDWRAKAQVELGYFAIGMMCLAVVFFVYFAIQYVVNHYVEKTSPEYRRTSQAVALVQTAMVKGDVKLDGLMEDSDLFTRPEGKSFLAIFPVMAMSVEGLNERLGPASQELVSRKISAKLGGAQAYFDKAYQPAISEVAKRWRDYSKILPPDVLKARIAEGANGAWADYVNDLARRGWSPSRIPSYARKRVVDNVRKELPVSSGWDPADEASFRSAYERKVRQKVPDGVTVRGQRIAGGLSFESFLGHPAIQAELREKLKIPTGIRIASGFKDSSEFVRLVYDPMVAQLARDEIRRFTAPLPTYEPGGVNYEIGMDAARSVIVPPIALGCSLIGALLHVGKIIYMLLGMAQLNGRWSRATWAVPSGVLAVVVAVFLSMSNPVTESRLYAFLSQQVSSGGVIAAVGRQALHVVCVGQGFLYPLNEAIRTKVLRGIEFGHS